MKEYKVKRYGRDRRHQKTAATLKTVLMVLLIAGACCAGWFLYDPISAWLTEKAEEHQQRQEEQRQQEQNNGEDGEPGTPGGDESGEPQRATLPEGCAVLDTAVLYDMAALENRLSALAAKGYTGAVFTLKDEDGLVLYQSALEDVTGNTAQTAQRYDLPAVIAKIKAAGLTPVGRLWAFDDHTAGRKLTDATVKYNYTETNWIHNDKEAGGHTWLNPMSERAQGYLAGIVVVIEIGAQRAERVARSVLKRYKRGLSRQNITCQPFQRPGDLTGGRQGLQVAQADMAVSGVIAADRSRGVRLFAAQGIAADGHILVSGNEDRNRVAKQKVYRVGIGRTGRCIR